MSDTTRNRQLRGGRLALVVALAVVVLAVIVLHLTGVVGPLGD